jgi:hypothetical protein
MSMPWWKRMLKASQRPPAGGRRGRPTPVRPRIEELERREVPTVFASIVDGQLRITDTSDVDTVTLGHFANITSVGSLNFLDSAITNGILIQVGSGVGHFDTVNIQAAVKPVTVDGQFDLAAVNIGKAGSTQGILAPVNIIHLNGDRTGEVNLDDSADTVGRTVTLNVVDDVGTLTGLAPATITFDAFGMGGMTINGGSGGNTFNVLGTFSGDHHDFSGIGHTALNTGAGSDTVNVLGTGDGVLIIDGQVGHDVVSMGNNHSMQGIQGTVEVRNVGAHTTLLLDDSANTAAQQYNLGKDEFDASLRQISGSSWVVEYVQNDVDFVSFSGGSGGNTVVIDDTFKNAVGSTTVVNTGAGRDSVSVKGTTGQLFLNGQSGQDSVFVGSAFGTANIKGNVFLTNVGSRTDLTVSDFNVSLALNGVGRAVTLDHASTPGGNTGTITGLAPALVQYTSNDVRSVTLTGSNFADAFFVRSTPGAFIPVTVNGGFGNDTLVVGSAANTLNGILGPVTFNGGLGSDTLIVNDQGSTTPHTYTLTSTSLTRSSTADATVTIHFPGLEFLQVNKGPVANPHPPLAKGLALSKSVRPGQLARLTGRLKDGDPGDTVSLIVDWGDGSKPKQLAPDRRPFALKHRYTKPGTYTVRVIWTDSSGESNFRDLTLTVKPGK